MRFYAVDTLSGRILDRLYPTRWHLEDPLRSPGIGTITLPKPDETTRAKLVEFTRPRRRWIAAQDPKTQRWVWGGPIPRKPDGSGNEIIIPLVDWRSYFYHSYLRPTAAGGWRDYVRVDVDQAQIAFDLFRHALGTFGPVTGHWPGEDSTLAYPPMVVHQWQATGRLRERTLRMLDRSIGESLDGLVDIEDGLEWWTSVVPSLTDPQKLEVHVQTAYPERRFRGDPLRIEYRRGVGGNTTEAVWPQGSGAPTRVWATGDGEPPDQAWAVDEDPDGEIVWEDKIGPLDGVKRSRTAHQHAAGHRQRAAGAEATAEFTLTEDVYALGDLAPGDRARVIYDDGWESVDVTNARIVSRTLMGGRGQATQQRLTLDLSDVTPPDDGTDPGVPGESEED